MKVHQLFILSLVIGVTSSKAFSVSRQQRISIARRSKNGRRISSPASVAMVLDSIPLDDLTHHINNLHSSVDSFHSSQSMMLSLWNPFAVKDPSVAVNAAAEAVQESGPNPVFQAFDNFQAFIQNSVVSFHDLLVSFGVQQAYGPSIILFTLIIRLILFPLNFYQLASTQNTQALNPKVQEIKEKYPNDKDMQTQMIALLYDQTKVNPLAGCLPAIVQIPVFLALYRSFLNLASSPGQKLMEPFLWLPNLEGPVYGERSTDWITAGWQDYTPTLGWHDTISFLSIPILLVIAQSISIRVLTPPSDDPAVQKSQQILKYLPIMLGYFSLSVPAGLGVYWVTNNLLSTLSTYGIKAYFKENPVAVANVDIEELWNKQFRTTIDPVWGYQTKADVVNEAKLDPRITRASIPADFI